VRLRQTRAGERVGVVEREGLGLGVVTGQKKRRSFGLEKRLIIGLAQRNDRLHASSLGGSSDGEEVGESRGNETPETLTSGRGWEEKDRNLYKTWLESNQGRTIPSL
jgi:hypothetical protein